MTPSQNRDSRRNSVNHRFRWHKGVEVLRSFSPFPAAYSVARRRYSMISHRHAAATCVMGGSTFARHRAHVLGEISVVGIVIRGKRRFISPSFRRQNLAS